MKRFIIALMTLALTATSCNPTTSKTTQTTQNDTNPVIETIMSRRSIRAYKDQAVPREILQQIAECGINAPTA